MQRIKFVFLKFSSGCFLYMLCNCYSVRLPCMFFAEFIIRDENHFYRGVVVQMKIDLVEFDCSIGRTSHANCKIFNYFKHNRTCRSLTSNVNNVTKEMLTPMTDVSFLWTNYSTDNVSYNSYSFIF